MDNASPTPDERSKSDAPPRPAPEDEESGPQAAVASPEGGGAKGHFGNGNGNGSAGHVLESTDGDPSESMDSGAGMDTLDTGSDPPSAASPGALATDTLDTGSPAAMSPAAVPAADTEWSGGRLSTVDAEAFAASIRPSWDVDWSGAASAEASNARTSASQSGVRGELDHGATVRAAPLFQDLPVPVAAEEPVIPGGRSSGMMLALVALLFLAGIVVVGIAFLDEPEAPTGQFADPPVGEAPRVTNPPAPAVGEPAAALPAEAALSAVPEEAVPEVVPEVAPEPVPEVVPEPPAMTRIVVTVRPANARVELDGAPLTNPDAEFPRDGETHVLRASADGYQPREVNVRFDRPRRETEIRLAAIPAPTPMREVAPMRATPMRATPAATPMRATPMRASMAASMGAGFTTDNPY